MDWRLPTNSSEFLVGFWCMSEDLDFSGEEPTASDDFMSSRLVECIGSSNTCSSGRDFSFLLGDDRMVSTSMSPRLRLARFILSTGGEYLEKSEQLI